MSSGETQPYGLADRSSHGEGVALEKRKAVSSKAEALLARFVPRWVEGEGSNNVALGGTSD